MGLTHFSQRYAKMPTLTEIEGHQNVGISFDMMQVNRSTLNLIPSLYPALKSFWRITNWSYKTGLISTNKNIADWISQLPKRTSRKDKKRRKVSGKKMIHKCHH